MGQTRVSGVRKPCFISQKLGKALHFYPHFHVYTRHVVGLLSGQLRICVKMYFENSASLQKSERELKCLLVILCAGRHGIEDL